MVAPATVELGSAHVCRMLSVRSVTCLPLDTGTCLKTLAVNRATAIQKARLASTVTSLPDSVSVNPVEADVPAVSVKICTMEIPLSNATHVTVTLRAQPSSSVTDGRVSVCAGSALVGSSVTGVTEGQLVNCRTVCHVGIALITGTGSSEASEVRDLPHCKL